MNNNDKLYIVCVCFIFLSLFLGDKIQTFFVNKYPSLIIKLGYTSLVILIFTLIYFLLLRSNISEPFFFQVSKCNPKCSGAYYGKPATFQFSPLSPYGTKCEDKNCGYGMISECNNPQCKGILNKYGGASGI
jgi:hypothetical protein